MKQESGRVIVLSLTNSYVEFFCSQVHSLVNVGNTAIAARRQVFANKGRMVTANSPVKFPVRKFRKGYSVDVTLNTKLQLTKRSDMKSDFNVRSKKSREDPISRLIHAAGEKRRLKTRAAKLWTLAKTMVCAVLTRGRMQLWTV